MALISRHTVNRPFILFDENLLKSLNMCASYLAVVKEALKYFKATILNRMHIILRAQIITILFPNQ